MMEQEKENSHHFQTMLLPSPAGDDISLCTGCTKPVWISSVAGTQAGETENTAAKFSTNCSSTVSKTLLLKLVFSGKFSQSFENKIKKNIKKAVG